MTSCLLGVYSDDLNGCPHRGSHAPTFRHTLEHLESFVLDRATRPAFRWSRSSAPDRLSWIFWLFCLYIFFSISLLREAAKYESSRRRRRHRGRFCPRVSPLNSTRSSLPCHRPHPSSSPFLRLHPPCTIYSVLLSFSFFPTLAEPLVLLYFLYRHQFTLISSCELLIKVMHARDRRSIKLWICRALVYCRL